LKGLPGPDDPVTHAAILFRKGRPEEAAQGLKDNED
jgi:hypothetical protein